MEWAILAERDQRIGRVLARLAEQRQRSKTTADREAHLRVGDCALRDHQPSPAAHQTTDGRLALDRAKIAAIALNILLVASISAPLYLLNARTDALRS